jgi:O-antigen/teichoic acid export membrane protein
MIKLLLMATEIIRKIIFLLLIIGLFIPAAAVGAHGEALEVYYAGPDGGVRQALLLDQEILLTADVSQAQVFVLNGTLPEADAEAIQTQVQGGAGLVLILSPQMTAQAVSGLLGETVNLEKKDDALSLNPAAASADSLLTSILWNSAPQVRERFALTGGELNPLVTGYEDGSLVLGEKTIGRGQVFVLASFLDGANPEFQQWAYFNYLVYHLVERAAGRTPLSFADYPASPVPHRQDQIILFALMGLVLATAGAAFWLVRRYSLAHPEALDAIVLDKEEFAAKEAHTAWEEIGFHRPLGGFFVMLFLGLLLFVPIIIYQNLILPVYILPSAQALGMWGRVTQFFGLIWTFFDMGTSVAFIKYLSEYRIHEPRKGVMFGQVFVWWQALSGAFQVALVVILAGTVLPRTAYAIYAWSVIVHTFIQIPGFYRVMRHALTGLQRADYAQVIDLGWALVFQMIAQPVLVTIMLVWGRSHPAFGVTMSGLIGLGLAGYAVEVMAFLLGLWLYRRLGYNTRVYFLAHFDWETVKKSFRFGFFEMAGSAAWALGQSLEILITQARLINYAEVWGNWVLAQNFVFGFNAIANLYEGVMPSISEAISHGKKILSQYYTAIGYKWGGMLSAMMGSMMLAVADRFILGASGPQFERAAVYVIPLLVWGAVQYPSWVGDMVQRGANKPWLIVAMVGLEQTIRITLALLLLKKMQINGLILAYFIGIVIKDIITYFVNQRLCYQQRFYFWQSIGAPLLAGLVHYGALRWVTGLIWQGEQLTSVLIFFIALAPSYPLFAFFYAFLGGWDDDTLGEVRRAVALASFMKPLAWLFWAASALGARLSPLHGRFPITIRAAALQEANALEAERVSLV